MKDLLKIIFIVLVILGLVASYTFLGSSPLANKQQANTEDSVKGPTTPPSTNSPDSLPPANK